MIGDAPLEKTSWQGGSLGGDGWIASAVDLVVNVKECIEVLHSEVQWTEIKDVREFNVVENLLAFVCQIVVQCIA